MGSILKSEVLGFGGIAFVCALTGCATRWMTPCGCPPAAPASPPAVARSSPEPTRSTPAPAASEGPSALAPIRDVATASPVLPKPYRTHEALQEVHFLPGRAGVVRADVVVLEAAAAWLKQNPTWLVLIESYTDDLGPRPQNLALGDQRGKAIKRYLASTGVEAERIAITSYGADYPVCAQKTEACRAKNRRVRFLVREREPLGPRVRQVETGDARTEAVRR